MVIEKQIRLNLARLNLFDFAEMTCDFFEPTEFHEQYYSILNAFACGKIRRLIVSIPPQHGKSLGSSQLLPAFMLGVNPDLNIAIGSYSFNLARKFNQRVQRVIDSEVYPLIFPNTKLKGMAIGNYDNYTRTTEEFDIIGHRGSLRAVGREGSLTGNKVDIMIIDDLYKDAMEANSPIIRENTWEWYTSVVKTRLHNDSQELIVFTRWHEDDLIGRIENSSRVVELTSLSQITDPDAWYKLNFEAIKESEPTQLDNRSRGVALWAQRHSSELLAENRKLDPVQFDCMYQGRPTTKEGLLYGDNFHTYDKLPEKPIKIASYTDTADTGKDFLCSICYVIGADKKIYVTDILYTSQPMEVTESATAAMLQRNNTRIAYIESNNGGRGFARTIARLCSSVQVEWFHQSGNKESRILTNSATVIGNILMPQDWRLRWSEFYRHLTTYKRIFAANAHDDAPDTLTGIVEREILSRSFKPIDKNKLRKIAY